MKESAANRPAERAPAVSEWDCFLSTRPEVGYKQSSWWAEFMKSRGWDYFTIAAREDDAICGGAIVLVKSFAPGRCFFYIPHGPVLPEDETDAAEMFAAIVAYVDDCRRQNSDIVSHLRLEPQWMSCPEYVIGFRKSTSWHEPRQTLIVDLTAGEDEILQKMKKKGRYNIRVARRHGVQVVADNSSQGLDDFLRLYNATMDRQEIRRHSSGYFRKLTKTLFADRRGDILFAEYQGERLATAMIVYFGDTATYKYGGSVRTHRNVMAPYLLHFQAMLRAKARGCDWYDFYGVSPADTPSAPWADFSAFKRKFGGLERAYVPSLDCVFDEDAYRQFRK